METVKDCYVLWESSMNCMKPILDASKIILLYAEAEHVPVLLHTTLISKQRAAFLLRYRSELLRCTTANTALVFIGNIKRAEGKSVDRQR